LGKIRDKMKFEHKLNFKGKLSKEEIKKVLEKPVKLSFLRIL